MTIRINSRALWFSALRGLGWGFLLFEVLFVLFYAVTRLTLTGGPGPVSVAGFLLLLVGVSLLAAAVVFPIQIVIETALRAIRPPTSRGRQAVIWCGVLGPVLTVAAFSFSRFWGGTFAYVYVWVVTIASIAASGLALLPMRGARPGEDEGEVVLPLWQIPLAVLAGLALGGFVYATLYFGWLLPSLPSLEEGAVILLLVPQFLLASTVGCYGVALMWRLSGQRESEAEAGSQGHP